MADKICFEINVNERKVMIQKQQSRILLVWALVLQISGILLGFLVGLALIFTLGVGIFSTVGKETNTAADDYKTELGFLYVYIVYFIGIVFLYFYKFATQIVTLIAAIKWRKFAGLSTGLYICTGLIAFGSLFNLILPFLAFAQGTFILSFLLFLATIAEIILTSILFASAGRELGDDRLKARYQWQAMQATGIYSSSLSQPGQTSLQEEVRLTPPEQSKSLDYVKEEE